MQLLLNTLLFCNSSYSDTTNTYILNTTIGYIKLTKRFDEPLFWKMRFSSFFIYISTKFDPFVQLQIPTIFYCYYYYYYYYYYCFRLRLNFIFYYFNYNCKIIVSYLLIVSQFYCIYWRMIYESVGRKKLFPGTSNLKYLVTVNF